MSQRCPDARDCPLKYCVTNTLTQIFLVLTFSMLRCYNFSLINWKPSALAILFSGMVTLAIMFTLSVCSDLEGGRCKFGLMIICPTGYRTVAWRTRLLLQLLYMNLSTRARASHYFRIIVSEILP